jgi:hypothetical protein
VDGGRGLLVERERASEIIGCGRSLIRRQAEAVREREGRQELRPKATGSGLSRRDVGRRAEAETQQLGRVDVYGVILNSTGPRKVPSRHPR